MTLLPTRTMQAVPIASALCSRLASVRHESLRRALHNEALVRHGRGTAQQAACAAPRDLSCVGRTQAKGSLIQLQVATWHGLRLNALYHLHWVQGSWADHADWPSLDKPASCNVCIMVAAGLGIAKLKSRPSYNQGTKFQSGIPWLQDTVRSCVRAGECSLMLAESDQQIRVHCTHRSGSACFTCALKIF